MRWNKPKPGDTRVVKKFLWLPRTINGETRWLEWGRVGQELKKVMRADFYALYYAHEWVDVRWVDDYLHDPSK